MVDTKISDLTAIASGGKNDPEDLFAIVDDSASASRKIKNVEAAFISAFKTADEGINNDTTLTDDADLQFEADANSTYGLMMVLRVDAETSTPDIKANFSIPAGASGFLLDGPWDFAFTRLAVDVTTVQVGDLSTTMAFWATMATFIIADTAGTIALAWAQNNTHAAKTFIRQGSYMLFKKLS